MAQYVSVHVSANINCFHNFQSAAFHGCSIESAREIFKTGLHLLKPGDSTITGATLEIKDGHNDGPHMRLNRYSNKHEMFDPNQIFVSPSIKLRMLLHRC